jgi:hypothetical protein
VVRKVIQGRLVRRVILVFRGYADQPVILVIEGLLAILV